MQMLKDMYTYSSVTVHLDKESETIRTKRGVRLGTPSHRAVHGNTGEHIIRLNCGNKGVKIDG